MGKVPYRAVPETVRLSVFEKETDHLRSVLPLRLLPMQFSGLF